MEDNGKTNASKYKNNLDREVFLDGISSKYISLKGHRKTCERFYRRHAAEYYKQQRQATLDKHDNKDFNATFELVPVEEENNLLKEMEEERERQE